MGRAFNLLRGIGTLCCRPRAGSGRTCTKTEAWAARAADSAGRPPAGGRDDEDYGTRRSEEGCWGICGCERAYRCSRPDEQVAQGADHELLVLVAKRLLRRGLRWRFLLPRSRGRQPAMDKRRYQSRAWKMSNREKRPSGRGRNRGLFVCCYVSCFEVLLGYFFFTPLFFSFFGFLFSLSFSFFLFFLLFLFLRRSGCGRARCRRAGRECDDGGRGGVTLFSNRRRAAKTPSAPRPWQPRGAGASRQEMMAADEHDATDQASACR